MKRKLNKLLLILALLMLAVLPAHAQAEGSITVSLLYQDQPQAGIGIGLCQIAAMEGNTFYPTAPFADSGMDLAALINRPDAAFAEDLHRYIQKHGIPCTSARSNAEGIAAFDTLSRGIYLVSCQTEEGYTFKPYLVFLPQTIGGETLFEIRSEPKVEAVPKPAPP
ncbi:MAG: hypothetical protein IJN82_06755, partial [Clostridia bacterium]|nr:hypothetical protein [Clostridia bacterium]